MSKAHNTLPAIIVTSGSILVGCGGHNQGNYYYAGSSCSSFGSCYASRGYGRYVGTLGGGTGQSQVPVLAIIDNNGEGRMSGTNGSYYRIMLNTVGSVLRGSLSGFSGKEAFLNGSPTTSGLLYGKTGASELSATITDRQGDIQNLYLRPANAWTGPSGMQSLAGKWSYRLTDFGIQLTVLPDGSFDGHDSSQCTYNGSLKPIDTRYDLYRESYQRVCAGVSDPYTGLLARIPTAGGADLHQAPQISILADDDDGHFLSVTLAKSE